MGHALRTQILVSLACDGTEWLLLTETVVIDNDVVLRYAGGEGVLTLDGSEVDVPNSLSRLLTVTENVTAELPDYALINGFGIENQGTLIMTTCTVSGHTVTGITNEGTMELEKCTISENGNPAYGEPGIVNSGTSADDQVDVSADDLKLGELADNGGPTLTHELLPDSVAIDVIREQDCDISSDQRAAPRPDPPGICDVGSFERQPEDTGFR